MSQRIFGLALVAMLAGCEAPTPPRSPKAAPQPHPAQREHQPDSVEEPMPNEGRVHVDDPAVVARLRKLAEEREALGTKVFEAGVAIDGFTHAGTAFNEVHIPEHKCFVLGQLLGKSGIVKSIEVTYAPDYDTQTTENASDLRIMSNSLHNFAGVAERVLKMSHDERVVTWNLDCAGQLGLPKEYIKQEGTSSFYVVIGDGKTLKVLGDIEEGYAQKIVDAIEANPSIEEVALGSGGGLVKEAMRAGEFIRQQGLETTLYNNCYSACPLVFMAGVQRSNWSPYADLGFHQIYTADGPLPIDSPAYRHIYNYLVRMDIEPSYVLQKMWSAPPQGMANVDGYSEELCNANITTWVQRGCTSKDFQDYETRQRSRQP